MVSKGPTPDWKFGYSTRVCELGLAQVGAQAKACQSVGARTSGSSCIWYEPRILDAITEANLINRTGPVVTSGKDTVFPERMGFPNDFLHVGETEEEYEQRIHELGISSGRDTDQGN